MPVDGFHAQDQLVRDLLVRLSGRDEPQHLHLAGAEAALSARWFDAEPFEDRAGRFSFELRAVAVAQRLTAAGHREANSRRVVRRSDLLPCLECRAEPRQGGRGVAQELDAPARFVRDSF